MTTSFPDNKGAAYWTREQVALRYGVHIHTVDNWREKGWLGFTVIGRLVRISREDLEEFERRMPPQQRVDGGDDDDLPRYQR